MTKKYSHRDEPRVRVSRDRWANGIPRYRILEDWIGDSQKHVRAIFRVYCGAVLAHDEAAIAALAPEYAKGE